MPPPTRPDDMVGRPVPDLTLTAHDGRPFSLRQRVGLGPQILFFYIRNGTPGWIRELREFRAHHERLIQRGLTVAGIVREPAQANLHWVERLSLPYPVLADPDGAAARAFGVTRRIGIGAWGIEFFRRSTFLVDRDGVVAAVWGEVKVRGHVTEIIKLAEALGRPGAIGMTGTDPNPTPGPPDVFG